MEEVDGPGPGLFGRLFVVVLRVGEVHERVIRPFVCEELMVLAKAGKLRIQLVSVFFRCLRRSNRGPSITS